MKNLYFLFFFSGLLCCGYLDAKPVKEDFKTIRKRIAVTVWEINGETKYLYRGIESKESKEELLKCIKKLREQYRKLKYLDLPLENQELLFQYCDVSLGVLTNMENRIQQKFWREIEESFSQLKKLNKDLNKDFGPTFWQRFKFWIQHGFK